MSRSPIVTVASFGAGGGVGVGVGVGVGAGVSFAAGAGGAAGACGGFLAQPATRKAASATRTSGRPRGRAYMRVLLLIGERREPRRPRRGHRAPPAGIELSRGRSVQIGDPETEAAVAVGREHQVASVRRPAGILVAAAGDHARRAAAV